MGTYVVFNKENGEIVFTHEEVALSGEALPASKGDVVALYRQRPGDHVQVAELDALEVESEILHRGAGGKRDVYVDVERRALRSRESESA